MWWKRWNNHIISKCSKLVQKEYKTWRGKKGNQLGIVQKIQNRPIGIMVRVFANGLGDLGSIPGRVLPKTQKMLLDASLFNTQHYKVWIKGKVEQYKERSSTLPLHLGVVAIEKGSLWVTLDYGCQLTYMHKPESALENETLNSLGFWLIWFGFMTYKPLLVI